MHTWVSKPLLLTYALISVSRHQGSNLQKAYTQSVSPKKSLTWIYLSYSYRLLEGADFLSWNVFVLVVLGSFGTLPEMLQWIYVNYKVHDN